MEHLVSFHPGHLLCLSSHPLPQSIITSGGFSLWSPFIIPLCMPFTDSIISVSTFFLLVLPLGSLFWHRCFPKIYTTPRENNRCLSDRSICRCLRIRPSRFRFVRISDIWIGEVDTRSSWEQSERAVFPYFGTLRDHRNMVLMSSHGGTIISVVPLQPLLWFMGIVWWLVPLPLPLPPPPPIRQK